jgi:carbamoyl-phosphate synthase small subunit
MKNCKIYIENGIVLDGKTNSEADFTTFGELVFTTAMTGYQEIITDPSFAGQIIVMSYPLIGNYDIKECFNQSDGIYLKAMIVSNADNNKRFVEFLQEKNVLLITIDTRKLIHIIRDLFYPKCVISTKDLTKPELNKYYQMINPNIVHEISTKTVKIINGNVQNNRTIGILDFGLKYGIIEELKKYFSKIFVLPYNYRYKDIEGLGLDTVLLSNGPGNPDILYSVIENIKNILGKIPVYGICLGHQLLALALNCQMQIMQIGHRGANHPVMNVETGKIIITAQNHGYEIIENSLTDDVIVTHRNIHDSSIEGIKSKKYNAQSVQFHPEASPGPNDAKGIFCEWFEKFII